MISYYYICYQVEDSVRDGIAYETNKIIGNLNCGFDSQYVKCPTQCNNQHWIFDTGLNHPLDLRNWLVDESITISSCKVFYLNIS